MSAYCSLRRAVPWQAKWDFPTMEEGARMERRSRRSSGGKMKEGKGEHWKRPRWVGLGLGLAFIMSLGLDL